LIRLMKHDSSVLAGARDDVAVPSTSPAVRDATPMAASVAAALRLSSLTASASPNTSSAWCSGLVKPVEWWWWFVVGGGGSGRGGDWWWAVDRSWRWLVKGW
jgi:hypothetical protein